jgi:hypothetical protein
VFQSWCFIGMTFLWYGLNSLLGHDRTILISFKAISSNNTITDIDIDLTVKHNFVFQGF